ncbi:hypothetical protein [Sphingobium sp.]|uniref:hypothetical protein n=1 Tax=Sphingobium sp. TaxID=1912891 RepID=UPI002C29EC13|nr:hypothetical protein [Sphingobium sp.]HUD95157.1 hypothetical protein [Sphingobium sp.]
MKPEIIACGLAMLSPSAGQARTSQWWYVTQGADKVLFVDVESIVRDGDTVRYEASQILREPNNPAASLRASMIGDCRDNTETWDLVLRYGADDERLDKTALSYAGPNPVEAGSVGAAQLQFICAADRTRTGGFPLAIDQVAFTEALIADTEASVSPADLHERMRADPKVPVIRSTAPAPDTFGTAQAVTAGHAIVPPRDYAKGVQIPDARNYDTIESGTIYDIAYRGIERGELAFDLRGYSIDDLAHSSSAQTMRFPASQKTIRAREIEIEVLAATPQELRFRASLARMNGDDASFVCADPACTTR